MTMASESDERAGSPSSCSARCVGPSRAHCCLSIILPFDCSRRSGSSSESRVAAEQQPDFRSVANANPTGLELGKYLLFL